MNHSTQFTHSLTRSWFDHWFNRWWVRSGVPGARAASPGPAPPPGTGGPPERVLEQRHGRPAALPGHRAPPARHAGGGHGQRLPQPPGPLHRRLRRPFSHALRAPAGLFALGRLRWGVLVLVFLVEPCLVFLAECPFAFVECRLAAAGDWARRCEAATRLPLELRRPRRRRRRQRRGSECQRSHCPCGGRGSRALPVVH